ncbi:anti-FecI sigma factor, FecR [Zunongwangia profunda SM-A87]|uniref:Anti-FecI sigma factor, FecR n=1 Tax=Zunongwangia profunda (strain DSM 18752 / CCTCC AB 206139 / SM-A87) TaxID=655815 RepID=D5BLX0_ZUNPS|nr:anti-FecI sigma factor, FecR [Zunongwangia profunda SM-A87]
MQDENNKQLFKNYVKSNYQIDLLHLPDPEIAYEKMATKLNRPKTTKLIHLYHKNKWFFYTAAVFIVLVATTWFINTQNTPGNQIIPSQQPPITIQLHNGKEININENDNAIQVGRQKVAKHNSINNQLSYIGNKAGATTEYNTIKIPYGKKYKLVLADSTIVHLNSGASLKFPVAFNGRNRKVVLTGEAFFEVTKDSTKPFIVESNKIAVEVLGTKFNMSDYSSDTTSEVVLVEGAVKMQEKESVKDQILHPGEKGTFNQNSKTLQKEKVDTELYTSWIYGKLIFRNKSFDEIFKSLERKFNVEFVIENKPLEKSEFNATFDKDVSLEKMLFYFEKAYDIQYTVKNNKIIIK